LTNKKKKFFLTYYYNATNFMIKITTFEVLGNVLSTIGLSIIGSGIYQVIHAGVIVFNAIFSKYFLNKTLNIKQWIAVIVRITDINFFFPFEFFSSIIIYLFIYYYYFFKNIF